MTAIKTVIQFVKATKRLQRQVVPRVEGEDQERGQGQMEIEEE
jgi:hypothetical protein